MNRCDDKTLELVEFALKTVNGAVVFTFLL